MEEESFLEAILAGSASDDDLGARWIYADWLQARGDARGELASVQLRRRATPEDPRLAIRERELLEQVVASLGLPSGTAVRHALGFVDELDLESMAAPDLEASRSAERAEPGVWGAQPLTSKPSLASRRSVS